MSLLFEGLEKPIFLMPSEIQNVLRLFLILRSHWKGTTLMTRSMKELAKFLGCTLEGDGATPVSGVASPASAGAQDLIYAESPRYLDHAQASASKCVVIATDLSLPAKTLLRADNPKLAFARASEWLIPATP